jgi:hypothetical protein
MHWQGGCGGFPCDGSGSLNEWNVSGGRTDFKRASKVSVCLSRNCFDLVVKIVVADRV